MPVDLLMLLRTDAEREQFAQFYNQYESLMFKAARQILDSQQDCEDAVQSSCAYLIDHFDKCASYDSKQVISYLILLIHSRSKDLRERQKKTTYEDIDQYTEVIMEKPDEYTNLSLEQAFERLPERYKEALTLRYYNDLPIKEMASLLQLSETAVRKLLQRSKDALRDLLLEERGAEV